MKEDTKVKVVACHTDHGFKIGEIVERRAAEYDEEQDSLGFYSEDSGLWYMQQDEYEIVDKNYTISLMVDAMNMASNQGFSRDVWEWGRVAAAIEQQEEELKDQE